MSRPARKRSRRFLLLLTTMTLAAAMAAGAAGPAQAAPSCNQLTPFDSGAFPAQPLIDSTLFPLPPGTQWVLEGHSAATGAVLPHRITFTISDETILIGSVRALVAWDVDRDSDQITESELAFFAQDGSGNVWTMGEYPEEYLAGKFAGAPSTWFHGQAKAEAGVLVPGHPSTGAPEFLQGSAPGIAFLDCALVVRTGQTVCIPIGCFNDVTVIDERSPLDPASGTQEKFYAPGVGNVQIGAIGDPEAETLVLAEKSTLSDADLAAARQEVVSLDAHGRQVNKLYRALPSLAQLPPRPAAPPPPPPPPPPAVEAPPAPAPPVQAAQSGQGGTLDPSAYVARIDNPLFPVSRLSLTVSEGVERDRETGKSPKIRVVGRLSPRPVVVAGVPVTAVNVREYENGRLVERTRDLYAQDREGNVWYFGEDVENIRRGKVVDHEGQWRAGRNGAQPGLFMPAQPRLGQIFEQERAPGIAEDRSTVLALGRRVRTKAGRFSGCVKVRDFAPLDRLTETKFYCRGVGLVRESAPGSRIDLVRFGR